MDFVSFCFTPNGVFEDRNKDYGAYWLRKVYERRVNIALAIGSALFTLGISSPAIFAALADDANATREVSRVVELKAIEPPPLDPKQPPPPVQPPPPPKVSTVRFVPPVVARDEEVVEEEAPPPQDSLKTVQAAAVTMEGDPNANPEEIIVEDPVNSDAAVVGTEAAPEVFVIVEQMPEFPGGTQALTKFLAKEIRYPEIARKAGVEGRVIVMFVIGPDGTIREPQVIRALGAGLDEEAVRAVMAMPKWIPGRQRGEPVNVRFSMPITFKLR